jgi:bacterioferritin (cytochrome b1)
MKGSKELFAILNSPLAHELEAVNAYNHAIKLAREVGDQRTADLLTKILKMGEGLVDWAEIKHAQIEQMDWRTIWSVKLKIRQAYSFLFN